MSVSLLVCLWLFVLVTQTLEQEPAKRCEPPMNISHGSLACDTGQDRYDYNTTCDVTCHAGYQIQGAKNITCLQTQQWTAPGTCIDTRPPILSCRRDIHTFAGPKRTPVIITYQLPQVKDNSGEPVNVTSDFPSGSWFFPGLTRVNLNAVDAAGNMAVCTFIVNVTIRYCPPFNVSGSPNFTCTDDNVYGSECTPVNVCNTGFELAPNATYTCSMDQTWKGQIPVCLRSRCPKPDLDTSGLMRYDCRHGYLYGETCRLSCSDGSAVIGDSSIICESQAAGTTGHSLAWNWEGSVVPSCQSAATCPSLDIPRNGALVCSGLGNIGKACAISCDENYMHPNSAPEIYSCTKPALQWQPDSYVPACYGTRPANEANFQPYFYYTSGSCTSNSTEMTENFLKALNGSLLWQAYCTNGISCTTADVEVQCYS